MDNPFWEYSLAAYREEGVAEHCLELQDNYGMDVNLLLYGAWLAQLHKRLDEAHLGELDARIAEWREEVVKPLRALRRQLREFTRAADLREEIKALELRAEREQQDMMLVYYQGAGSLLREEHPIEENLALVARFSSPRDSGWEAGIGSLTRLFSP